MDGRDIWLDLADDGRLTEIESKVSKVATENSASCVCITTTVEAKSVKTCEFALAWHMPEIKFGLGQKVYKKFVDFFRFHCQSSSASFSKDGIPNGLIKPLSMVLFFVYIH